METVDDETNEAAIRFIREAVEAEKPFFVWWNGTRMHFRTHVREELRGIPGQDEYADGMVEHDRHTSANSSISSTSSASRTTRSSSTAPTTART